ncbi:hypothetical protein [Massilia sp. S19_KUP03_FR1]|uniref:hypothetical protein n=1 Tax=Massilia sp. S19_KUP03_FR1 TaxID=3025503 RepID=UPI002FCD73B4
MFQFKYFSTGLCAAALLLASAAAFAQTSDATVPPAAAARQASDVASGADPARWTQDDTTRASRLAILRKEIGAAQAEALSACAKQVPAARGACVAAAKARYQQDMAGADAQVDTAPGGSVTTTVTTKQ